MSLIPSTGLDLGELAFAIAAISFPEFVARFGRAFLMCSFESRAHGSQLAPTAGPHADNAVTPHRPASWRALPLRSRDGANIITLGRLAGNDICVPDENVSKYHAFIVEDGGRFMIVDAGSRNGTMIGDAHVPRRGEGPPVALTPGCAISLGGAVLTFMEADAMYRFVSALQRR